MPHFDTVYAEAKRDPSFSEGLARARFESAHALAESVVTIADEADDPAMAQLVKNRCDQRRWLAGVFNPMYAPKPVLAVPGSPGARQLVDVDGVYQDVSEQRTLPRREE